MASAQPLRLADLSKILQRIAPLGAAESWDNVGLLVGDPNAAVTSVLLCIDVTRDVVREARDKKVEAIVCYHPPIFEGLKKVVAGNNVYDLIAAGIGVYCVHTALDAAKGGTNDVMADKLGLTEVKPLRQFLHEASMLKLVTFVPHANVEAVSSALFAAGAGALGKYSSCSFQTPGTGTFLGGAGSKPAVGTVGKLERTAETRLEVVVPEPLIAPVVAALRRVHPYEEVAYDLVRLAAIDVGVGMGRVGVLETPLPRPAFAQKVAQAFGTALRLGGPTKGTVRSVALCAGAGGEFLSDALKLGVDAYVTGELRHHDILRAGARGMNTLCLGHWASERPVLETLAGQIQTGAQGLKTFVSERDCDPERLVVGS